MSLQCIRHVNQVTNRMIVNTVTSLQLAIVFQGLAVVRGHSSDVCFASLSPPLLTLSPTTRSQQIPHIHSFYLCHTTHSD